MTVPHSGSGDSDVMRGGGGERGGRHLMVAHEQQGAAAGNAVQAALHAAASVPGEEHGAGGPLEPPQRPAPRRARALQRPRAPLMRPR